PLETEGGRRDSWVSREGAWLARLDVPDGDRADRTACGQGLAIRRKGQLANPVPGPEAARFLARGHVKEPDRKAEHEARGEVLAIRRKSETRGRVFRRRDAVSLFARLHVPHGHRVLEGTQVAHDRRANLATGGEHH